VIDPWVLTCIVAAALVLVWVFGEEPEPDDGE